ncbi:AlpA family phage regulatory protein [Sinorhizobium sp. 8-89]|uniref:helix-turn-helix transcriptional regulator n=1 Tax=Sinorhizobium sp. 7-81 TaxID=3049087 RepID=UPI0024C3AF03|nr:AlpA family phage regulatory protein [Sinorhizobium sp. 7-81]MDK1385126.1 AlpA family phage regulatory protein [Sinorhizobium sp. 7-81]
MGWDEMMRLLRRREVELITGLSRTTLWRYEGDGRFPGALRLPGGDLRWLGGDVWAWILALPSGRSKARARWENLAARRSRKSERNAAAACADEGSASAGLGTRPEERP